MRTTLWTLAFVLLLAPVALAQNPTDPDLRAVFSPEAEQTLRERFITPDECAAMALKGLKKGLPKELDWFPFHAAPRVVWSASSKPLDTVRSAMSSSISGFLQFPASSGSIFSRI